MSGLKAFSVYPEHAELFRLGVRTIETRSYRVNHRGPVAIHATLRDPDSAAADRDPIGRRALAAIPHGDPLPRGAVVATANLVDCVPMVDGGEEGAIRTLDVDRDGVLWLTEPVSYPPLPPGRHPDNRALWEERCDDRGDYELEQRDVSAEAPYGDFSPGRFAWLLDDVKPTTERCPACWGDGEERDDSMLVLGVPGGQVGIGPCAECHGAGHCDPIPAKGASGVWRWEP